MNKRFISKGEWFDKGTEAKLISDSASEAYPFAIFEGIRNGKVDEETCTFDEFEILEDDHEERNP
jgi:hypothetical protein